MTQPLVLVTGGTGFLAQHIIQQLLIANYAVRATVRSLTKGPALRANFAKHNVPNLDQLSFVTADLLSDDGWADAMQDVTTVMSVAAPVFVDGGSASTSLKKTAQTGTLRILRAAKQAGVKRVVMTANLGAVGFSHFDQSDWVTETDWTDPDQPGLSPYEQSKLLAEQSAWQYVQQESVPFTLTTVNAGAMLGPSLDQHVTGSFGLVDRLLKGQLTPNLAVNVVDVRDVATLHVRAMADAAAGERFLAVAPTSVTMQQIIALLQRERPALAARLPKHLLPNWVVNGLAPFNATVKEAQLMMRLNHRVSTEKAQRLLGWQPEWSADQAILAATDQLTEK